MQFSSYKNHKSFFVVCCIKYIHLIHYVAFIDSSVYDSTDKRSTASYLKDNLSKFFAIVQYSTTILVIDLDASNGNLNEAREISFPSLTFTSYQLHVSGGISDNMLFCSTLTSSTQYQIVTFINTDSWTLTSYNTPSSNVTLFGFSKLYDTDKIALGLIKDSSQGFSLRAAYDKLNYTELYTQ